MPDGRFATLLTCIDGRVQDPLQAWVRDQLGVDYVDTITEPGPEAHLASADDDGLKALMRKVAVSREAHGSTTLVVAAHSDCAGNPVPDREHHRQLRLAVDRLSRALPGTRIVAVHAGRCGSACWDPRPVAEALPT